MKFLYDNYIDSSALSNDGTIPGFGLANLLDTRLSRVYRSIGTLDHIVIDLGTAKEVDTIAIAKHNINTSEITVEANTVNSWVAPAFSTPVYINTTIAYETFAEQSAYRYWRITINDPTVSNGQIEIGRLGIGKSFIGPPLELDVALPLTSTSEKGFSRTRQFYANEGIKYRACTITFGYVTQEEKTSFDSMFEISDTSPVFLDFDQLPERTTYYALLSGAFEYQYNIRDQYYKLAMDFEEVF